MSRVLSLPDRDGWMIVTSGLQERRLLSSVRQYSEPEEMEAAHVAARAEIIPTTRQPLTVRVSRLALDNLWLVRVQESAPRLRHIDLDPTRTFISFPTSLRSHVIIDGIKTATGSIVRHSAGQTFVEHTHSPTDWANLSLPSSEVGDLLVATVGSDVTAPRDPLRVRPRPEAMARLLRLHAEAVALGEHTPSLLASSEVQRALKQTMIEAAAQSLEAAEIETKTLSQRSHGIIMRRFRKLLEESPERPHYIPEVCATIGVPERSLRACFQVQLGMGPKQYLRLRRLHLARRALLRASHDYTVTAIAMQFGFWHLGRFSQAYQQVHGEQPSQTLARLSS